MSKFCVECIYSIHQFVFQIESLAVSLQYKDDEVFLVYLGHFFGHSQRCVVVKYIGALKCCF